MTNPHKLLLVTVAAGALALASQAQAQISIAIGDRPYYTHGASYWNDGVEWYWIPGHRYHGHWVRGHYAARGGVRVVPRVRVHTGYWGGW